MKIDFRKLRCLLFLDRERKKLPPAAFAYCKKPEISVVLLTFNQWTYTDLCLRSLALAQKTSPPMEVIVVDNASEDETSAELKKIPGLKVVLNKKNRGYAGGNNQGIRASRGHDIVLLNNDTVLSPETLARLQAHARSLKGTALLGPSTNTETGQDLPSARYQSLQQFFALNRRLKNDKPLVPSIKLSGLCLYIPRRTLNKVGLLDEKFGLGYFEDDDYCLRVSDQGGKLFFAKDVFVHHFGSVSFQNLQRSKKQYVDRGIDCFVAKWGKRGLDHIAQNHRKIFAVSTTS